MMHGSKELWIAKRAIERTTAKRLALRESINEGRLVPGARRQYL
jgi:hypothetical protein